MPQNHIKMSGYFNWKPLWIHNLLYTAILHNYINPGVQLNEKLQEQGMIEVSIDIQKFKVVPWQSKYVAATFLTKKKTPVLPRALTPLLLRRCRVSLLADVASLMEGEYVLRK